MSRAEVPDSARPEEPAQPPALPPLYHFYHIWVDGDPALNHGIVREHARALKMTGLHDALAGLYVGLVGTPGRREEMKRALAELGLRWTLAVEADVGYEQVTQNKLYELALDLPSGYVLYAHNKASQNPNQIGPPWRRSMTYFNVVRWREAVGHLADADAVGCHWIARGEHYVHPTHQFFGGTFWWARLEHVRRLGYPSTSTRWGAEVWIGDVDHLTVHDLRPGGPHWRRFVTEW